MILLIVTLILTLAYLAMLFGRHKQRQAEREFANMKIGWEEYQAKMREAMKADAESEIVYLDPRRKTWMDR